MSKIPSLSEELQKCERDYVQFVFDYSGRDAMEAAKIAKVSAAQFEALLEKHRLVKKSASKMSAPITKRDNLSKSERIKMACGKGGATAKAIHKKIGGSYGSLGVYLAQMKGRGELGVVPGVKPFKYRVPN